MRREIGEGEVAYGDRGDGPALVLLHPFPFDRRIWADNVPALAAAGRRVIAVDYPGFGESGGFTAALPSIAAIAARVGELLDALGIGRAAIAGVSMGGYVGLALAAARPALLEALVLADTRAAADGDAARAGRARALDTLRERGVDAYLDEALPRLLAPGAGAELAARAQSLAERRPETLAAAIAALRDRPDRSDLLPHLACPVLVLAGAADQVVPPAEMRAMAAAIPGADFVELPGAGHLTNLEVPDAFNRTVAGFLRGLPARAAAPAPARGTGKGTTP
jgi:pimeloyl-ACP methyl ester carboxylesterase